MPLTYDDVPGSWGRMSQDWPRIVFDTQAEHDEARRLVIRDHLVPYGSYVTCGLELRLETEEYVQIVRDALK